MNELDQYLTLTSDRKDIIQQIVYKYCTDSETFWKIYLHCLSDTARKNVNYAISELYKEQIEEQEKK